MKRYLATAMWGDAEVSYASPSRQPHVRISLDRVKKVKKYLQHHACSISKEPTPLEDITLAKGVTAAQYRSWVKKSEESKLKTWGMKVEYFNNCILATELAGRGHAAAVSYLAGVFFAQDPNGHLLTTVDEDMDLPLGEFCKPDFTVNVKGQYNGQFPHLVNLSGGVFPTIVVEVGVAQTAPDLCGKLNLFRQVPSLQLYLIFKRFASDGMVAMMFDRAANWSPTHIISFGPVPLHRLAREYIEEQQWIHLLTGVGAGGPACSAPGIPTYILQLPSNVVFTGRQGGLPLAAPAQYAIDLFPLQERLPL